MADPGTVNVHTTDQDFENDRIVDRPYARFSRQNALELTTDWVRLDYNGTSPIGLDTNTYPGEGVEQNVYWDSVNKLFKFKDTPEIRLYDCQLSFVLANGFRPASVEMRFVIPTPTPIYFPAPDYTEAFLTLAEVSRRDVESKQHREIIRTTSVLRQYGLGVELRTDIDPLLLANMSLVDANIQIYSQ